MLRPALAIALCLSPYSALADEHCIVCASGSGQAGERPLTIEITSSLEFSRMALTGGEPGQAELDAQTGSRKIVGGLVGLGGLTMQGRARITGAPMRPVRIDFPPSITMTSSGGGKAELTDLTTTLSPFPTLDANGVLEFGFGGRLKVIGAGGGSYRARIPISVDYN